MFFIFASLIQLQKNLFLYDIFVYTDWYQIFEQQAVSMKYCYSNFVGKTGIWYTCTVSVQLKKNF